MTAHNALRATYLRLAAAATESGNAELAACWLALAAMMGGA